MNRNLAAVTFLSALLCSVGCSESKDSANSSEQISALGGMTVAGQTGGMRTAGMPTSMDEPAAGGTMPPATATPTPPSAGTPMMDEGASGGEPVGSGTDPGRDAPESIAIEPGDVSGPVGTETELKVRAVYDGGTPQLVTEGITWSSSNEDVATVSEAGVVILVGMGMAAIRAEVAGVSTEIMVVGMCDYPQNGGTIAFNEVVPPLVWNNAYRPDGSQFDFGMAQFHCSPQYEDTKVLIMVVGAGWCGPCSNYTKNIINPIADDLIEAGAEILYVEAEDTQFAPADSRFAFRHIRGLIADGAGIRVGDADTYLMGSDGSRMASSEFIQEQDLLQAFPSVWVVRKRDMRVIADQNRSNFYLPLRLIVADPEADWSDPPPPPFESNCLDGEEEDLEPNDSIFEAKTVELGQAYEGGICNENPDFYRILTAGKWKFTLTFSHQEGDLDVYLWDKDTNQIRLDENNRRIGSFGVEDVEVLEGEGPAYIAILGYNSSSANYTLTVEEIAE